MKKIILLSLILSITSFSKEINLDTFNNLFAIKSKGIKVQEYKQQDEIYILNGIKKTKRGTRGVVLIVTKDMKYVFLGRGFNSKTGEKLYIQKDITKYKEYINFTYGKGDKEYYLFTDPECPYCIKFEKKLINANIKNKVKIHYILYPLPFHKEAKSMSQFVLSQKTNEERIKAFKDIVLNNSKDYKNKKYTQDELLKINKKLKENKVAILDVLVKGTPSLYESNGKKIKVNEFLNSFNNTKK